MASVQHSTRRVRTVSGGGIFELRAGFKDSQSGQPSSSAQSRYLQPAQSAVGPSVSGAGKRNFQSAFRPNASNERLWKKPKIPDPAVRRVHSINEAIHAQEPDKIELVEMVSSTTDSDDLIWVRVGDVLIEMQID